MGSRPLVFIGSSMEGLPVAKGIQLELEYAAECVIWSQGVFGLSEGSLDSLVKSLDKFDFAILVLTPDDLTESRGESLNCPRDNVLLELGMFIGGLGRERTYVVIDRSAKIKLPSDLAGVTTASYAPPEGGTIQSAVGPACTTIENAIKVRGKREDDLPVDIDGSYFENIRGEKGISFTVTNRGKTAIPPFTVGLFHHLLGSYFIFPTEKDGVLYPNQKRVFSYAVFKNNDIDSWLPTFDRDNDGKVLTAEENAAFKFRLVLEDSDNEVLFESNEIGNGLVALLRKAKASGLTIGGTGQDWRRLFYRSRGKGQA